MKSIISKSLMLAITSIVFFSFTSSPGGEGFEIYLNNKVVLQQFGTNMDNIKSLRVNENSANDQLSIKYHHCGRAGKNRMVTVKDSQNKVLKEWKFTDVKDAYASMNCNVKDITALKKQTGGALKLYYSSSELPNGRLLALIEVSRGVTTAP